MEVEAERAGLRFLCCLLVGSSGRNGRAMQRVKAPADASVEALLSNPLAVFRSEKTKNSTEGSEGNEALSRCRWVLLASVAVEAVDAARRKNSNRRNRRNRRGVFIPEAARASRGASGASGGSERSASPSASTVVRIVVVSGALDSG